jgi:hypothetical protein
MEALQIKYHSIVETICFRAQTVFKPSFLKTILRNVLSNIINRSDAQLKQVLNFILSQSNQTPKYLLNRNFKNISEKIFSFLFLKNYTLKKW